MINVSIPRNKNKVGNILSDLLKKLRFGHRKRLFFITFASFGKSVIGVVRIINFI